jgi:hypothetical protein
MFAPAATGLGVPTLVTAKSQFAVTGVVMDVLLLAEVGSLVVEETEEAAVMEATATEGARFTITIMSAELPDGRLAAEQVTLPVPPTAGVVQVQPAGAETDAKVVFAGVASRKVGAVAAAGPLLVMVCV